MSAHTPGPWVVDYGDSVGHIKSVPTKARMGVTPTPTVCRYDSEYRADTISDEQAAANARLIAAAPDMLNVLREVADFWAGTDAPLGQRARDLVARVSSAKGGE